MQKTFQFQLNDYFIQPTMIAPVPFFSHNSSRVYDVFTK